MEKLKLCTAICYGIQHIHLLNIIHRDISTSNNMIDLKSGNLKGVKIIDYGFGTSALREDLRSNVGIQRFKPPEIKKGNIQWSKASDIYALGVVFG